MPIAGNRYDVQCTKIVMTFSWFKSMATIPIAGNRHDGQLGNSAWWSSYPKVGLDLFVMEIMMIMMMAKILMIMIIMMMRIGSGAGLMEFNLTSPTTQSWLLYCCFCIWINVMFPKGWTARENGNGKDFLTMMELNSPRYSCSANGCGDGWNGSDGFDEKIWQTIIFGQCRGIWE